MIVKRHALKLRGSLVGWIRERWIRRPQPRLALATPRLLLRDLTPKDSPDVIEIRRHPLVRAGSPGSLSREDLEALVRIARRAGATGRRPIYEFAVETRPEGKGQ